MKKVDYTIGLEAGRAGSLSAIREGYAVQVSLYPLIAVVFVDCISGCFLATHHSARIRLISASRV